MSAASRILLSIVAIVVAAGAIAAWVIRGPGPIDFAGSQTVALADYKGANPTGVPASLAKASLVERGAYLARAADCMACHTKPPCNCATTVSGLTAMPVSTAVLMRRR